MAKEKEQPIGQMTLYDYSKQVVANEVPMDPVILNRKFKEIAETISKTKSEYYMLLCRELNDYTIFHLHKDFSIEQLTNDLIETLQMRGNILLADEQQKATYEIWIRNKDTEENFAYYLFNYDIGVVEVN